MATEATFLQLLTDQPGDAEARLVYADWLEGQGEHGRARLLRLHVELAATSYDHPRFVTRSRALLGCSRGIDVRWIAAINHPRLEGTCWGTRDHDGVPLVVGFLANGALLHRRTTQDGDGTWGQVGNAIRFGLDASVLVGAFVGDRMRGSAHDAGGASWSWEMKQLDPRHLAGELPELPPEPMDRDYVEGPRRR